MLPQLRKYLKHEYGLVNYYTFRATFSEQNDDDETKEQDWSNMILNMEQIAYNPEDKNVFEKFVNYLREIFLISGINCVHNSIQLLYCFIFVSCMRYFLYTMRAVIFVTKDFCKIYFHD